MRWLHSATSLAALGGLVPRQGGDSTSYVDSATNITFASYQSDNNIQFRIAVPELVGNGSYDAIVQITAPIAIGWAAIAWGGSMTYNPLTIAWANGAAGTVVSSRYAFGYYVPPAYAGATYTVLSKGSFVNATHWQLTAKCTGCTQWGDDDTGVTRLEPAGQNPLAFAYSTAPVNTPASNASSFGIHDSIGHPIFDFAPAVNKNFDALVQSNL